jgi:hypothetical protein
LNFNRLNEVEQRRVELNNSYRELFKNKNKIVIDNNGNNNTDNIYNNDNNNNNNNNSNNYNESNEIDNLNNKLKSFLTFTEHNKNLLEIFDNRGGVGSKKNKSGLPSFVKESLVCVKNGNFFWSQEYLGYLFIYFF